MSTVYVFLLNQQAAYEMRISDWSSDVCSSDLGGGASGHPDADRGAGAGAGAIARQFSGREFRMAGDPRPDGGVGGGNDRGDDADPAGNPHRAPPQRWPAARLPAAAAQSGIPRRSEEHTSELQSLMRISYAVFCLKKKTQTTRETM